MSSRPVQRPYNPFFTATDPLAPNIGPGGLPQPAPFPRPNPLAKAPRNSAPMVMEEFDARFSGAPIGAAGKAEAVVKLDWSGSSRGTIEAIDDLAFVGDRRSVTEVRENH